MWTERRRDSEDNIKHVTEFYICRHSFLNSTWIPNIDNKMRFLTDISTHLFFLSYPMFIKPADLRCAYDRKHVFYTCSHPDDRRCCGSQPRSEDKNLTARMLHRTGTAKNGDRRQSQWQSRARAASHPPGSTAVLALGKSRPTVLKVATEDAAE